MFSAAPTVDNQLQMTMSLLIVDDHTSFRSVARKGLEHPGFEVGGEVGDGESALEAVRELEPDVVLLDVQLPGIDGFEVAQRLTGSGGGPALGIVWGGEGG